jgi:serine/threonine protein kinase
MLSQLKLFNKGSYGYIFTAQHTKYGKIIVKFLFPSAAKTHKLQLNESKIINKKLYERGIDINIITQQSIDDEIEMQNMVTNCNCPCPILYDYFNITLEEFSEFSYCFNEQLFLLLQYLYNNKKYKINVAVVVMEFMEGYTPIDLNDSIDKAKALAVLVRMTKCGINHGDFSCENILIDSNKNIVIIDYGLAFPTKVPPNLSLMDTVKEMMEEKTKYIHVPLKKMFRWVDDFLGFNKSVRRSKQQKNNYQLLIENYNK